MLEWEGGRGRVGAEPAHPGARPIRRRRRRPSSRFGLADVEELPFAGGAVGLFGYDLVRPWNRSAEPNPDPLGLPDLALMVCELIVAFDHHKHEVSIIALAFAGEDGSTPPTKRARSS